MVCSNRSVSLAAKEPSCQSSKRAANKHRNFSTTRLLTLICLSLTLFISPVAGYQEKMLESSASKHDDADLLLGSEKPERKSSFTTRRLQSMMIEEPSRFQLDITDNGGSVDDTPEAETESEPEPDSQTESNSDSRDRVFTSGGMTFLPEDEMT